jgi:hypothetical protein
MRATIAGVAAGALATAVVPGLAAGRLAPSEIQATFFNGQSFTSSTPSNIKFTMVFTPDGKVSRQPLGNAGLKGEGTWKLDKDGFCTTWKGSRANCFIVSATGENKWTVMKGPTTMAVWSK